MREERIPIIEVRRTYRTGEVRIVDGDTVICREDTYNFRRPKVSEAVADLDTRWRGYLS